MATTGRDDLASHAIKNLFQPRQLFGVFYLIKDYET